MKGSNFWIMKFSIKALVACLLLSNEFVSASVQVGGAKADTDVNIGWLATTGPEKRSVYSSRLRLPNNYEEFDTYTKGQYAQNFAHTAFLSQAPTNPRGSRFAMVSCNGTYDIAAGNGYDGFYLLLDVNNHVARFSESGQIVMANSGGDPIIIVNESKACKDGRLLFGKGINLRGKNYAAQMSEAWLRIVAYSVLKQKAKDRKCPITNQACKEPNRKYAACETVHDAVLGRIVEGSPQDLRRVFRTATVLDDNGNWCVYALGSNEDALNRTEALLRQLF